MSTEIKPCLGAAPAGSQRPRAAGRWRTRAAQAAARAGPGGVPPPPPRPPPTSPPAWRANCWMLYWDRGLGGRKREWEAGKRGRECGSEYTKPPGSRGPGARRPPPPSLLLLFRPHPQDQGADQRSRRITARKMVIPVRSRTRCCARLPPKPGHLRPQFTHPGRASRPRDPQTLSSRAWGAS